MARRRAGAVPTDLRAALVDRDREISDRYAPAFGWTAEKGPWCHRIRALEAGDPVEFGGWEIAWAVPGVALYSRYVVEADGTLTERRHAPT